MVRGWDRLSVPYWRIGGSSLTTSQLPRPRRQDFRAQKMGPTFRARGTRRECLRTHRTSLSRRTIPLQNQPSPNRCFDVSESASGLVASSIDQLSQPLQAHGLQSESTRRAFGTASLLHRPLASPFRLLDRGGLLLCLHSMCGTQVAGKVACHLERSVTFRTFERFLRHHESPFRTR